MPTWLITGCSTGLGRALAQAALDRGDSVAATARDAATIQDLVDAHPDTALALALDVTDGTQITGAVSAAQERFGAIDVLVNNAGYGYRAAVEEAEDSDMQTLFATNFFGPVAIIRAVLPGHAGPPARHDRERFLDRRATLAAGVRLLRGDQGRAGGVDRLAAQGG